MDEKGRRRRIIEDREKQAALALGIDYERHTTEEQLEDAVTHFLVDALHLADHKRQSLKLDEIVKDAEALHEPEKIERPPRGGVIPNQG